MNKTAKKLIIKGILSELDARWAINEALEKAIDEIFDTAYRIGFEDGEKTEDEF